MDLPSNRLDMNKLEYEIQRDSWPSAHSYQCTDQHTFDRCTLHRDHNPMIRRRFYFRHACIWPRVTDMIVDAVTRCYMVEDETMCIQATASHTRIFATVFRARQSAWAIRIWATFQSTVWSNPVGSRVTIKQMIEDDYLRTAFSKMHSSFGFPL